MSSTYNHVYEIKINTYGSGVQGKVGGANPQRDKASDGRRTTRVCICSTPRFVSYPQNHGFLTAQLHTLNVTRPLTHLNFILNLLQKFLRACSALLSLPSPTCYGECCA